MRPPWAWACGQHQQVNVGSGGQAVVAGRLDRGARGRARLLTPGGGMNKAILSVSAAWVPFVALLATPSLVADDDQPLVAGREVRRPARVRYTRPDLSKA